MTSPDASSATNVNFSLNENEALAADNPVPRQRRGSPLVVVAVSAIRNRSVPLCPKLNTSCLPGAIPRGRKSLQWEARPLLSSALLSLVVPC